MLKRAPSYRMLMLISCGAAFGCYFATNMRLPVVPLYARSLGINTAQIGFINSAFFLMAGFLSLPFGFVSDRWGRKLLASLGLLVLTGASFLLYFSNTFVQLTWAYIFIGIGVAAFSPTMMSFVADISPVTHLGRSYGWYTTRNSGRPSTAYSSDGGDTETQPPTNTATMHTTLARPSLVKST